MKHYFMVATVIAAIFLSGCNATHKSSVTPEQYKTNFKIVLLRDLLVDEKLAHKTDAIAHIETKLNTLLEKHGFSILPASLYNDTLASVAKQRGGYINTVTGNRDSAKYKAVRNETLNILHEKYNVTSMIMPQLRYRNASFGNYRAQWDGQEETYEQNNSDVTNFLSTLLVNTGGTAPALSLVVFVEDNNANQIYMGAGGIQLLAKVNDDNEFENIPDEQIMGDPLKLDFAINESLRKLLDVKQH